LRFSRRWLWRMPPSGMWRRATLLSTDVSEEHSASIIRVTWIGELGTTLAVTSNRCTLWRITMSRATWRNIPEDGILPLCYISVTEKQSSSSMHFNKYTIMLFILVFVLQWPNYTSRQISFLEFIDINIMHRNLLCRPQRAENSLSYVNLLRRNFKPLYGHQSLIKSTE
jgi:hypothetical protein